MRLRGERDPGMADPADLDALVHVERDGDDLRVEIVTDDTGRDRVSVETDHEVEDGRTVGDPDLSLAGQGGEDLLSEVERVVRALIEGEPRQVRQILEGDAIPGGQRVVPGDENVRDRLEERLEDQPGIPQEFVDDLAVEVVPEEHPHLTAERPDVLDDVPG